MLSTRQRMTSAALAQTRRFFVFVLAALSIATTTPALAERGNSQTQTAGSDRLNLNFRSAKASVQVGQDVFGAASTGTITVGRKERTVTPGQRLTPAEFAALTQVLNGGTQTLKLSGAGKAIGGSYSLNSLATVQSATVELGQLIVPRRVNVLNDFGAGYSLVVAGDLRNSGNFYAFSSNSQVANAAITANNIYNNRGALLTSLTAGLPSLGVLSAFDNIDLSLSAKYDIINSGTISGRNLNLAAGGSIVNAVPGASAPAPVLSAINNVNLSAGNIVNSGLVTSQLANINVTSLKDIAIIALGGKFSALNGVINVRDAGFTNKANLDITGGDFFSKAVNLFSGTGNITAYVNSISGKLNMSGHEAHSGVQTGDFNLGDVTLTGDPLFYNTNGPIILDGSISTNGQFLGVLASGNIAAKAGTTIDTSSGSGSAGDLLIVAGATFDCGPGHTCGSSPGQTSQGTLVINGFNSAGNINLTGVNLFTTRGTGTGNGSGGNITMIAPGTITNIPELRTGGVNSGTNGDVRIIAGNSQSAATAVSTISPIDTSGGSGGGGNVSIAVASPGVFGSSTITTNGVAPLSGLFFTGSQRSGDISLLPSVGGEAIKASRADITLRSGGDVSTGTNSINNSYSPGSGNGGTVTIDAAGNVTTGKVIANAITSGAGGTVYITGKTISIGDSGSSQSIQANGAGATAQSNGGTIFIIAHDNQNPIRLANNASCTSCIENALQANPTSSGKGGVITVANQGSAGITVDNPATIQVNANPAASGDGGVINLDATDGALNVGPGTLFAGVAPGDAGSGGSISLKASSISVSGVGALVLQANGRLSGDGGKVSVTTTAPTSSLTIGNGSGQLDIDVQGNALSGAGRNGGTVEISTGRDLIVNDAARIQAAPQGTNGNGAEITLTAGTAFTGHLVISGTLDADGKGTGSSGSITLKEQNAAGDITLNSGSILSARGGATDGGSIELSAPKVLVSAGTAPIIRVSGGGSGHGGSIGIEATHASSDLTIGTGSGQLRLEATGGSGGSGPGNAGTVDVSVGSNLTVNGAGINAVALGSQGHGANISLTAGTSTSGVLQINGALQASGAVFGAGGLVQLTASSPGSSVVVSPGASVSATGGFGKISIITESLTNNGTLTASKSGGGFINITSLGALNYNGTGSAKLVGLGAGEITLAATGANALTFGSGSKTFDPGTTGLLELQSESAGGSIVFGAGSQVLVDSGANVTISTPALSLLSSGNVVSASGASNITINSNSGASTSDLHIRAADGGNAVLSTTGGAINIALVGGQALFFEKSGLGLAAKLSFKGGNVTTTTVGGGITVDSNVIIASDSSLTLSAGGILSHNGELSAETGLTVQTTNDGSIVLGGNISAPNVTLSANGTGSVSRTSGVITAANLTLLAGSGVLGSANAPIVFSHPTNGATVLTASTNSDVFVQSLSAVVLGSSGSSVGNNHTFSLSTQNNNSITVSASLVAGTINLTANGSGNIVWTAGTLNGNAINLSSGTGNIGGLGSALQTQANILSFNTGGTGSVFINNTATTLVLNQSQAGGIMQIETSGNLSIAGNLTTLNGGGGLNKLVANGLNLTVNPDVVLSFNEGNLLIQNNNTTNGGIHFGARSKVSTASLAKTTGRIDIVIGDVPTVLLKGKKLKNAKIIKAKPGLVWFGAVPLEPTVKSKLKTTLSALRTNLVINRPSLATSITFGESVRITADPAPPAGASAAPSAHFVPVATSTGNVQTKVDTVSVNVPNSGILSAAGPNIVVPVDTTVIPGRTHSDSNLENALDGRDASATTGGAVLTGGVTRNVLHSVDAKPSAVRTVKFAGATMKHSGGIGITEQQPGQLVLHNGEALISASKPTIIKIGAHAVAISAGSIALVSEEQHVYSVRNLHGHSTNAVRVSFNGEWLAVGAGQEMMIGAVDGHLSNVMQRDQIARRGVKRFVSAENLILVRSEVSPVSLMHRSAVLSSLVKSHADRTLADKLLKMAACLMQVTSGHGAYSVITGDDQVSSVRIMPSDKVSQSEARTSNPG